jgi:hypothetical protein
LPSATRALRQQQQQQQQQQAARLRSAESTADLAALALVRLSSPQGPMDELPLPHQRHQRDHLQEVVDNSDDAPSPGQQAQDGAQQPDEASGSHPKGGSLSSAARCAAQRGAAPLPCIS